MDTNWPYVPIGPMLSGIIDYRGKTPPKSESGIPCISAANVKNGRIVFSSISYVSEETYKKWATRGFPKPGDVVITAEAPVGEVGAFPDDQTYLLTRRVMALQPNEEILHPKFLLYALQSPLVQNQLEAVSRGTTVTRVLKTDITGLGILLPPLPEQKAIAHILGSLDDKIELNRQMNETLEGMAQALFKSWFVDFDPVIDNALAAGNLIPEPLAQRAGLRQAQATADRSLSLSKGAAVGGGANLAQFPDSFTFTEELGWIPAGWDERQIGDCFQLLGGHSFKSKDYVEEGIYGVVTIKNVQDGYFVEDCTNRITILPKKMKEHCRLNSGDVLLSLTGNVGRVCIVSEGDYVLNQRVSKIIGTDGISEGFTYFFFRQRPFYEKMIVIAKGTAQKNLSPIETAKLKQVLPSNKIIHSLSSSFDAIFKKIEGNISENMTLQKLRDTLLPKLISGELRIPDAEKLAEQATL